MEAVKLVRSREITALTFLSMAFEQWY